MGESITEATVADWHVQPGQAVESGDILVELETDKVTMEVPAPVAGVLKEIKKQSGVTVTIDEVLAVIEEGAAGAAPTENTKPAASAPAAASPSSAPESAANANTTLAPGARRLADEQGVNPADVTGSGKRGQVTKSDIVDHLEKGPAAAPAAAARKPKAAGAREEIVPMSRLRQRIAERLVEAQRTAAILTTFNEVDMHNVMEIRSRYKDKFKETHGVGLGFMSFFVHACVDALKAYPGVNAEIRGTDIVYKNYYDIGVAVGGPKGLVVPIVRDVDTLTFAGVEQ